jgi:hypothetical protein
VLIVLVVMMVCDSLMGALDMGKMPPDIDDMMHVCAMFFKATAWTT